MKEELANTVKDSLRYAVDSFVGVLSFDVRPGISETENVDRIVKQTSIGVRRGELVKVGMVRDSGTKGTSDTGSPCIRWALTNSGQDELKAGAA